eukprot:GAFH01001299.1.p1 GENE.GAFH01001299.1~~GAFH01001299.1.p1  ORF type:complete len:294 (-),score=39.86 GAFH01001299.1:221-1102(-)
MHDGRALHEPAPVPGDERGRRDLQDLLGPGLPSPDNWPEGLRLAQALKIRLPTCVPTPIGQIIHTASPEAIQLMTAMLRFDPAQRPSAADALLFPYFQAHLGQRLNPALDLQLPTLPSSGATGMVASSPRHNAAFSPDPPTGFLPTLGPSAGTAPLHQTAAPGPASGVSGGLSEAATAAAHLQRMAQSMPPPPQQGALAGPQKNQPGPLSSVLCRRPERPGRGLPHGGRALYRCRGSWGRRGRLSGTAHAPTAPEANFASSAAAGGGRCCRGVAARDRPRGSRCRVELQPHAA